jgi:molecular chaperone GrpE
MTDHDNDFDPQHTLSVRPGETPSDVPPQDADEADSSDAALAERDRFYDLLLRKTAEFDNYRKRVDRERREWTEGAVGDVIAELLPVVDDLERALKIEAIGEQAEAYRKGFELTYKRLLDTLKKRNVMPIDAVGHLFDPHFHQAVIYEPVDGKPDGEIIEEFARGYVIGDRLLRPSMVKVAQA